MKIGICDPDGLQAEMKEICERYAHECCKASLERAMVQVAWNFNDSTECKEMITNPDNIVIL